MAQPSRHRPQTGFIDTPRASRLHRPPEAGGDLVRDAPLSPASRVFASGRSEAQGWWYVTAFVEGTMLRGYVEAHRSMLTCRALRRAPAARGRRDPRGLAKEKYGKEVPTGHDLRYYENVLLDVTAGATGIAGTTRDPNVLGGGANNIKLYAGHRIWLSAPIHKALEGACRRVR